MPSLAAGDRLPALTLPDQDGKPFDLGAAHGKVIVLYFYPKDETRGCTVQACSFRDAYQDFTDAGAIVVGVSSDDAASHRAFADHHRLPFTLLADTDSALRKAMGVPRTLGLLPGRVTYVVDRGGIIRHVFNSQLQVGQHITEALAVVRRLQGAA
jgi:peroxiredoxin Q/BCP